jgi:hypothetical protein
MRQQLQGVAQDRFNAGVLTHVGRDLLQRDARLALVVLVKARSRRRCPTPKRPVRSEGAPLEVLGARRMHLCCALTKHPASYTNGVSHRAQCLA